MSLAKVFIRFTAKKMPVHNCYLVLHTSLTCEDDEKRKKGKWKEIICTIHNLLTRCHGA